MIRTTVLAFSLLTIGCSSPDTQTVAEEKEPFVPVTVLSQTDAATLDLVKVGTIGSESDSLYYFGNVSQIRIHDGSLMVLDLKLRCMSIYGKSTHEFIGRHYFSDGDGPGEIRGPIFFAIDGQGRRFVSSNNSRHIHIFNENWDFLTRMQEATTHALYPIHGAVHAMNNIQYVSDAPLVKVLDGAGGVSETYGRQHQAFSDYYSKQRLQGVHHVFLAHDDSSIYLVYSLPMEVFQLDRQTKKTIAKYSFSPSYQGGLVQDQLGVLTYPSGRIVGADRYGHSEILVFAMHIRSITNVMEYAHFLYMLDIQSKSYMEVSLDNVGLRNLPGYTRTAVDDGKLYMAVIDPFPAIQIYEIRRTDALKGGEG